MVQNIARVWNTGTPENPIFNFELPTGAKGEPGGLVNATNVWSAQDCNLLLTPGHYYQVSGSSVALNWPVAQRGNLAVYGLESGQLVQEFTPQRVTGREATIFFRRVKVGTTGTWSPWRTYASQRVDNTAGRAIYTWDDINDREQLIYGDTGLRNISGDMQGIQPQTGNTFSSIRRVGNTVTLNINGIVIDQDYPGQLEIYVVPDGFKNSFQQINMYPLVRQNPISAKSMQLVSQKYLRLYQDPKAGEQIRHQITWETVDPWPTTLPGV